MVTMCCMDIEGRAGMGDATRQPLNVIINNQAFQRVRRLHAEGRSSELPVCRHCDVPAVAWPFVLGAVCVDDFQRRRLIALAHKFNLLVNIK